MANPEQRPRSELPNVEALTSAIIKAGGFWACRLVSKDTKSLVDRALQRMAVKVSGGVPLPEAPLPMAQWSSCTNLAIIHQNPSSAEHSLLSQPFVSQKRKDLQRITSFALEADAAGQQPCPSIGPALSQLLILLPNLKTVSLGGVHCWPEDAQSRQHLVKSLGFMAQLENVSLPGLDFLPYIGGLEGSRVRALEFCEGPSAPAALPEAAYSGLAQLQGLERLVIKDRLKLFAPGDQQAGVDLTRLFRSLPSSLQRLVLDSLLALNNTYSSIQFWLREGHAAAVKAGGWLSAQQLLTVAQHLLLAELVPAGHQLELLTVEKLVVPPGSRLASAPKLQPLRDLLGCCREVRVEQLYVEQGATAAQALDALACVPRWLVLAARGKGRGIFLRADGLPQGDEASSAPPQPLPTLDGAMDSVLRAMTSPGGSTGPGPSQPADAAMQAVPGHLVLWGPFIAMLAKSPGALEAWLKGLWERAVAAGGPAGQMAAAQGEQRPEPWKAVTLLPACTKAVVVELRDAAGVAPMVQAATEAARGEAEGLLQAAPVFKGGKAHIQEPQIGNPAHVAYVAAVQKVLQDLLDQRAVVHSGTGPSGSCGASGTLLRSGGTAYLSPSRALLRGVEELARRLMGHLWTA